MPSGGFPLTRAPARAVDLYAVLKRHCPGRNATPTGLVMLGVGSPHVLPEQVLRHWNGSDSRIVNGGCFALDIAWSVAAGHSQCKTVVRVLCGKSARNDMIPPSWRQLISNTNATN